MAVTCSRLLSLSHDPSTFTFSSKVSLCVDVGTERVLGLAYSDKKEEGDWGNKKRKGIRPSKWGTGEEYQREMKWK
jgi:hypothetical protein